MFISKDKYELLVKTKDHFENLAREVISLNSRILDTNKMLIDEINKLRNHNNPLAHPESYLDDTMAIVDDMTTAQRKALLAYLEEKIEGPRGKFE